MPKGSTQQFINELNNRIDALEDRRPVESTEDINVRRTDIDTIYGEDDDYINQLVAEVKSQSPYLIESWNVGKDGESDDAVCFHLDDAVVCVPFRDLTGALSVDVANILAVIEE